MRYLIRLLSIATSGCFVKTATNYFFENCIHWIYSSCLLNMVISEIDEDKVLYKVTM